MKIYYVDINLNENYALNVFNREYSNDLWLNKGLGRSKVVDIDKINKLTCYIDRENFPKGKLKDFMGYANGIIITEKIYNSDLIKFFTKSGQVGELDMTKDINFPNIRLWLHNITKIVDCLNIEKSECTYFKSSGRLNEVINYVFNENNIPKGTSLFRIPEFKRTSTMLVVGETTPNDDFYFLYHKLGLTGLKFIEKYRTPGEKDYDMEKIISKMNNNIILEKPLFKKGFFNKFFG